MATKIRKELATGRTFKGNLPLTAKALAAKRAQMEKYDASLTRILSKNLKPVLDKIDSRADKTDDLIVGVANLMLGHIDTGKMSRVDERAALRMQKTVIHNRSSQILAEEKAEREAKKLLKKGKKVSAPPAAVVQDQAVAFAEAVSSGAATSSAPPAAVVQEQAVIQGNIIDSLARQKASFKKLNSKARLAKLISMIEVDGPVSDFLKWAEAQFPFEYKVALKRAIEQSGIPGLE